MYEDPGTDFPTGPGPDVVELQLLLPMRQLSALEAVAARSKLTVNGLLLETIDNFLQEHTSGYPMAR
jgi:hypothetical protein